MQRKKVIEVLLAGIMLTGCSSSAKSTEPTAAASEAPAQETAVIAEMTVTSDDVIDGVWKDSITSLSKGENKSPELTWTSVPGAEEYAIYMIDISANNWLHWQAYGIKSSSLASGEAIANSQYKGPYPPSGTHTYEIHVYALKGPADAWPGTFDAANESLELMETMLDTANGNTGNIISSAYISGTASAD